jgi:multiple antibiotic resistance protein
MTFISAVVVLFLVLDPLGNVPIFLIILGNVEPNKSRRLILRESLFALIILTIFLFAGKFILEALSVKTSSLGIAGGVILLLISIKMIFTGVEQLFNVEGDSEPFIFPLAVPLVAGPSAITTVILIMAQDPSRWPEWFAALYCAWFTSSVILYFASDIGRFIGKRGLAACEKLMGMLLTAVAVQMFINGLRQSNIL